ncbi:MAG: hypothetical protein DIZ77_11620 [endosymbiont of Seepiophila jonesi]|uniref:DUF4124 domain-containing protein n=1 Tax=endosymbiont of Lamellibrachia luymesi TaxID=2200907 RepID=A0A370E2V1_9GAMM|nr:MAG: hypothetical protein DIZ77_11620 [endosymbiont of Seepiophila jonesi]RDH92801.1 MAG: hypothetical protein DIZ79_02330 [endosymbiont of Lamellibrachia luymesi]
MLFSSVTQADKIYKWYDDDGLIHYSQTLPHNANQVEASSGRISVVEQSWSAGMKKQAKKFMGDAGVRRVWVDQNGKKVSGWY